MPRAAMSGEENPGWEFESFIFVTSESFIFVTSENLILFVTSENLICVTRESWTTKTWMVLRSKFASSRNSKENF